MTKDCREPVVATAVAGYQVETTSGIPTTVVSGFGDKGRNYQNQYQDQDQDREEEGGK